MIADRDLNRVLVIKAKGGFGNRILSAATGIVLAALAGRRPVIDWREGMYLPAGQNLYPALFERPADDPGPEAYDAETDVVPAIWSGRLHEQPIDLIRSEFPRSHSNPFVYRRLSLDLARPAHPAKIAVFWSYLPKFARLRSALRRDLRFSGQPASDLARAAIAQHFRPNARVRSAVDALFAQRERPIIGVHIRYTDRKAPLGRIERELARLRQRLPDAAIFLATDNSEVERRIMRRFAGAFVIEKEMGSFGAALHFDAVFADPLREAENALIDLWALSRCDWLIHSRHSTFSVAAALIGRIPRSRQVDVDRYTAKVVLKRMFQRHA
jgi:hypothetical protein